MRLALSTAALLSAAAPVLALAVCDAERAAMESAAAALEDAQHSYDLLKTQAEAACERCWRIYERGPSARGGADVGGAILCAEAMIECKRLWPKVAEQADVVAQEKRRHDEASRVYEECLRANVVLELTSFVRFEDRWYETEGCLPEGFCWWSSEEVSVRAVVPLSRAAVEAPLLGVAPIRVLSGTTYFRGGQPCTSAGQGEDGLLEVLDSTFDPSRSEPFSMAVSVTAPTLSYDCTWVDGENELTLQGGTQWESCWRRLHAEGIPDPFGWEYDPPYRITDWTPASDPGAYGTRTYSRARDGLIGGTRCEEVTEFTVRRRRDGDPAP